MAFMRICHPILSKNLAGADISVNLESVRTFLPSMAAITTLRKYISHKSHATSQYISCKEKNILTKHTPCAIVANAVWARCRVELVGFRLRERSRKVKVELVAEGVGVGSRAQRMEESLPKGGSPIWEGPSPPASLKSAHRWVSLIY